MSAQKQIICREKLPSGNRFMPNMTMDDISEKIKKVSSGKSREILMACYRRKNGASLREIARQLMKPHTTIRDWLVRITERGINGIWDKKSPGRKRILNPSDVRKMEKWMCRDPIVYNFQSASWNMDMVVHMFEWMTGECRCSIRTLQRALRLAGFSYSKPRPIPCQSASPEEQKKFKNKTKKTITRLHRLGYVILVADETGILKGSAAGYGWRLIKNHDTIRVGFETKSTKFFGVLKEGKIYMQSSDKLNSDAFIDFLKEMLKIHGKFVLILDNASYHTSIDVDDFIESTHGNIKLIFLPPYTPQLNPIEIQWRLLKKLLAGRYFKSVEELVDAVNTLIETGQMKPVKLMDYLVPAKPRKTNIL